MTNKRNQPPSSPPADTDPVLPLPHERDTSVGHVDPEPRPRIRQASRDLKEGQVDTDLRSTPGLDAQRRRKVTPGKPTGQRQG